MKPAIWRCEDCGWEDLTATQEHHVDICGHCGGPMTWWVDDHEGFPSWRGKLWAPGSGDDYD